MKTRLRLLTVGLLLLGVAGAAANTLAAGDLAFTDSSDLAIDANDGRGEINVAVLNAGAETTVVWSVILSPTDEGTAASATVEPAQSTIAARGTQYVPLVISGVSPDGKLKGVLVGTPASGAPFTRPITVSKFGLALPIGVGQIIAFALVLSLVLVAMRYWRLDKAKYHGPLTNPKWSFSQSWASTFTGAGALLATLVSAGALPQEPYVLAKEDFAGLGIFFGALGLVAPVVFLALNNTKSPVLVFHVATWLTTAGVIGQLTTIVLLLVDALGQSSSSWLVVTLGIIEVVGVVMILTYVYRAVPATIQEAAAKGSAAFPVPRTPWALL